MQLGLREGLERVGPGTASALAVLATVSGYFTYLGARGLFDRPDLWNLGAAAVFSAAVSVGIWIFWLYTMAFVPTVRGFLRRPAMFAVMLLGCTMIVAMSSWLNATALSGDAALQKHLEHILAAYEESADRAFERALGAQELTSDLRPQAQRFRDLAERERRHGIITGSPGEGAVTALLDQVAARLEGLAGEIEGSRAVAEKLREQAMGHLRRLHEILLDEENVLGARRLAFVREIQKLAPVITELGGIDVAPAIARAAAGLDEGIVLPAPSAKNPDLARRQREAFEQVRKAVAESKQGLQRAAEVLAERPVVEAPRMRPVNAAKAVFLYMQDFVPAWAAAVAIDMIPAVLVFYLVLVVGAMRREARGGLPVPVEAGR